MFPPPGLGCSPDPDIVGEMVASVRPRQPASGRGRGRRGWTHCTRPSPPSGLSAVADDGLSPYPGSCRTHRIRSLSWRYVATHCHGQSRDISSHLAASRHQGVTSRWGAWQGARDVTLLVTPRGRVDPRWPRMCIPDPLTSHAGNIRGQRSLPGLLETSGLLRSRLDPLRHPRPWILLLQGPSSSSSILLFDFETTPFQKK